MFVDEVDAESKEKESIESEEAVESMCRDNRALIDNNTAQTLSAEDIEQMRRLLFLHSHIYNEGFFECLVHVKIAANIWEFYQ